MSSSRVAIASSIAVATSTLAGALLWADYRAWKNKGTGGTPSTLAGYYKIQKWGLYLLFHPQDLHDPSFIPDGGPSYLSEFPEREFERPGLTRWVLPQRQQRVSQTQGTQESLSTILPSLANSDAYKDLIYTGPSKTEGGTGTAIYVRPEVPTINPKAKAIFYEIAHVHPSDSSLHVYLSPRDARVVVEKKWGERFSVDWIAPKSWVLVYAPRNATEVEVIREIVEAGIKFAVEGGKEN
ncbi:hypothetical protein BU24DRAFT_416600 [Aaosphaeria arxii CBS 175.79]|uniref:Luciferase domain-containing protein n=1 Tax=Aaosphaeria arxii CBS 175.79 TaxID=1450172 RepID=A0A6A5Y865_9PLEO|nr:uncharacterized protein BU24DRAFT_416600 [Aaosphaeria arxii CBS 175.79]KAF2020941.1 hypothetical protein BU24DRAFT_416600 [Aaosphaeria arxii CBS 175.79]